MKQDIIMAVVRTHVERAIKEAFHAIKFCQLISAADDRVEARSGDKAIEIDDIMIGLALAAGAGGMGAAGLFEVVA